MGVVIAGRMRAYVVQNTTTQTRKNTLLTEIINYETHSVIYVVLFLLQILQIDLFELKLHFSHKYCKYIAVIL